MLWVLIRIASAVHKNICCGYSLESPHQGDSNEYLQQGSGNIENWIGPADDVIT